MPPISRLGDDVKTGHICAPLTYMAITTNITVFAEEMPIVRIKDITASHAFPPKPPCAPHVAFVNKGVMNVLVSGIPCGTIGKSTDLGILITGAPTVIAGGVASGGSQKAADGSRNSLGQQAGGGARPNFAP